MPYLNLKGEMAKQDVKIENLAELLGVHRNSISKKINGPSSFSIEEAFKIHDTFFPQLPMDYLFRLENEN